MTFLDWLKGLWPIPVEKPPAGLETVDPLHWHDFLHFLKDSVPKLAVGPTDSVVVCARDPFCSWVDSPDLVLLMKERLLQQGIWLQLLLGSEQTEPWPSVIIYFRADLGWFQRREALMAEIHSRLLPGETP